MSESSPSPRTESRSPLRSIRFQPAGEFYPHWRDDAKELIYVSLDRRTVMSAEVVTKPVFQVSASKALFQLPAGAGTPAVTGDGERFLVAVPVSQSGPQQFTVVLNCR